MAALHLDNLLFLLFVVLAIFFQILTRAATKSRRRRGATGRRSTSPSQMSRPLSGDADETDEERIRRFLEALGQPTTSKPPAPVRPRTDIPPRPVAPVRPPIAPFAELQRKTRLPGQIPPTRQAKTFRPKVAETPVFEFRHGPPRLEPLPVIKTAAKAYAIATQPISKSAEAKIDIAALLGSASGLRDAIILREIFGPPRSLQPLDLVGSV
jgi:hypothetical protein